MAPRIARLVDTTRASSDSRLPGKFRTNLHASLVSGMPAAASSSMTRLRPVALGRRRTSPPCPRFASLRWRQPPWQPRALSRSRRSRARPRAARAPTRTRAWAARPAASGVGATIAPTATPSVRDGHVDGWIGVGGAGLGPNGTDEWIQIGLTSVPNDPQSSIYYEIAAPRPRRRLPRAAPERRCRRAAPLRRPRVAARPNWWRVWLDGSPASAPVFLPGSHDRLDGAGRRRELGRHDERHLQRCTPTRSRTCARERAHAAPGARSSASSCSRTRTTGWSSARRRASSPAASPRRARVRSGTALERTGRPRGRPVPS